jgi:hypothetical protein|tara:strand:- start:9 stop:1070 length:1062 start_codon:yes stop_codon:yes gene_type:complete
MAYTTIDDPTIYFNTKLYTGNATDDTGITGVGFQPDMTWIKERSETRSHVLFDVVRGATVQFNTNDGAVDATEAASLQSFDSDGFTVGTANSVNKNSQTYVAWNWKAGTSFSNSAGANGADLASTGSYNRDAGFSIVTWTGNATDDQQIYHGLNAVPQWMLVKNRTNGNLESWKVYHQAIANTHALTLDTTAAKSDNVEFWSDETPTSTVFTVGRQDATNNNSMIAYCFADVKGYSKVGGSYVGSGSAPGTFSYLGFKPAFLLMKESDGADGWGLYDNKRNPNNTTSFLLQANDSGAESNAAANTIDFLSNGFRVCASGSQGNFINESGKTYIYAAFAEQPFVTSGGVPATAR